MLLRYEAWGIDQVRAQVKNPDRRLFTSPEVIDIARAWVRKKEEEKESERRTGRLINHVLIAIWVAMVIFIGISFVIGMGWP